MFLVGFSDDRWSVPPAVKVLVQVLATVLVLYEGIAFWRGAPDWVSLPLTFLWIIGVTNAVNLIDGIDGLAAAVTAVAAGALALTGGTLGLAEWTSVGAAVTGASLGFLVYNVPPARIFMGDCGSLFLGYSLAVTALAVQGGGGPVAGILVPVVVPAVPIFDVTFVTVTRMLRGHPVTEGGTDHTHHRLIKLGLSEGQAVLTLAAVGMAFGGVAVSTLWLSVPSAVAIILLGFVACGIAGGYLDAATSPEPSSASHRPSSLSARVGAMMRTFVGGAHWKAVLGVVADFLVVGAAFVVALHLRHGGAPPENLMTVGYRVLPGLIAIKLVVFYAFGLYEGIWRHAGTDEIIRLIVASTVASLACMLGWRLVVGAAPPVALLIIDGLVATVGVGGVRFSFRALRQLVASHTDGGPRALVYGSSTPAVLLVRYLRAHPALERTVVGLLDDEPARQGYQLQGTKVLGCTEDLPRLADAHDVEEVVVPLEAATPRRRRALRETCDRLDLAYRRFLVSLDAPQDEETSSVVLSAGDGAQENV
jgi:UDP-GlcNAc:undecaprenyl-phosphate GlcNAc-1-phosphate transferase